VESFKEKPTGDGPWINGGFFVMEPGVFDYLAKGGDSTVLERKPLERLAETGQLNAHKHYGFWHPMDTLHDKNGLTNMWTRGNAPWALWLK
jgi:glucose-1-phosphate cytidylyltransferase